MNAETIVKAPRGSRCQLLRRARAARVTPQALLGEVLARHTTLDGAATEMGVTRRAIEKWMRRYSVRVDRS
jgi:hypothetical protein